MPDKKQLKKGRSLFQLKVLGRKGLLTGTGAILVILQPELGSRDQLGSKDGL